MAYNHEKYIARALDSFLMQEVAFPFEIIIHDDASADATAEIIRGYEKKHPDIIKPIYQSENQYSQGKPMSCEMIYPCASGKYIAFCCGDDYWTDRSKLQLQVDYMEANQDCALCLHAYYKRFGSSEKKRVCRAFRHDAEIEPKYIVSWDYPHIPQISSAVFRRKDIEHIPVWAYALNGIEDYPLYNYLLTKGTVHYIDRAMSVWLYHKTSWTKSMSNDFKRREQHTAAMASFLDVFNEKTDGKYIAEVELAKKKFTFVKLMWAEDYKRARKSAGYKSQKTKTKMKVLLGSLSPKLVRRLKKITG